MATLTRRSGGYLLSEGTFVPTNGLNVVAHGLDPETIIDDTWLSVVVQADGPSVIGATYGGLSADRRSLPLTITQMGGDSVTVQVVWKHSMIR
jgi:hypothetical protein